MELWFTCLTVPSSKPVATDAFITSKRILTSNSVINAWVVEALVDICKTKKKMHGLLKHSSISVKRKKKKRRKNISLSATFLLIDFILTHILRSCLYNGISLFSVASLLLLIITLFFPLHSFISSATSYQNVCTCRVGRPYSKYRQILFLILHRGREWFIFAANESTLFK